MKSNLSYVTRNPVVYLSYLRTNEIKIVFEAISNNKPKKLYLFSDGPKDSIESVILNNNRKWLLSKIDWECDLKIYFLEENMGPYKIWRYITDTVFAQEDTMIYLQEDILPSNSFFRFCDELLYKYKDDNDIYAIGGHNYLEIYNDIQPYSVFFNHTTDALGIAFWKRTYDDFLRDYSILNDSYTSRLIFDRVKVRGSIHWYNHLLIASKNQHNNIIPMGEEFDIMGINPNILFNKLAVISSVNLIKHIGLNNTSSNFSEEKLLPKEMLKLEKLETFEIEFPMNYPNYKIIDYNYTKLISRKYKRKFYVKFLRAMRILIYGGPKLFIKKSKYRIKELLRYQIAKKMIKK